MLYDINPIETAAEMRLQELRGKAQHNHLIRELNRQRRQMRGKQLIALMRKALDALEAMLDKRIDAPAPQRAVHS